MELSIWVMLLLLLKLISYIAIAALVGGLLVRWLLNQALQTYSAAQPLFDSKIRRWQLRWAVAGLIAALMQLPVEAGAIAETSWSGMTNTLMLSMVWQSVIGTQALWRVLGLSLAVAALFCWRDQSRRSQKQIFSVVSIISVLIIAVSFSLTGHVVELGTPMQALLVLHVLAIACWLGALWPLYVSCKALPVALVSQLMHRFGQTAIVIVLLLLLCGVLLITQLVGSLNALFTTGYGQLLLFKLMLVSSMLLLAAWHKLVLVPRVARLKTSKPLYRSIAFEGVIGMMVLLTTSVFTTLLGPSI